MLADIASQPLSSDQLLLILIAALVGIVFAAVVAWLVIRNLKANWQEQLLSQQEQGMQQERLLEQMRQSESQVRIELAAHQERLVNLDRVEEELFAKEEELEKLRNQLARMQAEAQTRDAEMKLQQQHHEEKLAMFEQSREQLQMEFKQLAQKIFEENGQKFGQQQQEKLTTMLQPFRQQLGDFRKRVDDVYERETRDRQGLKQQIEQLQKLNQQMSQDAINLTNALKAESKTQGNWGELILSRVLEQSGLRSGVEYELQPSFTDEAGKRFQPDVIVKLPENKVVVVDAKVSLVAYERYCSSDDEGVRQQALQEHIGSIKRHIKGLSEKSYEQIEEIQSLDFVVLFVPIEAAFLTAIETDTQLFNEAFERNILLVSPTTLLVTLRTINNIWRHEKQNQNALEIAKRGGELYDKLVGYVEALDEVGRYIRLTQKAYDTAESRLHTGRGNLVNRAEQLRQLGARAKKNLPEKLLENADISKGDTSSD